MKLYIHSLQQDYTDALIKEHISNLLSKHPDYTNIEFMFWEIENNKGVVAMTMGIKPWRMETSMTERLHIINLEQESFKDCVKEIQREKALIKRAFPQIKVSSNLH